MGDVIIIFITSTNYSMMKKSLAAVSYDHKNRLQFSEITQSTLKCLSPRFVWRCFCCFLLAGMEEHLEDIQRHPLNSDNQR